MEPFVTTGHQKTVILNHSFRLNNTVISTTTTTSSLPRLNELYIIAAQEIISHKGFIRLQLMDHIILAHCRAMQS